MKRRSAPMIISRLMKARRGKQLIEKILGAKPVKPIGLTLLHPIDRKTFCMTVMILSPLRALFLGKNYSISHTTLSYLAQIKILTLGSEKAEEETSTT